MNNLDFKKIVRYILEWCADLRDEKGEMFFPLNSILGDVCTEGDLKLQLIACRDLGIPLSDQLFEEETSKYLDKKSIKKIKEWLSLIARGSEPRVKKNTSRLSLVTAKERIKNFIEKFDGT